MALKSKKRRIAELDGSEGPAKKQRIETTPVTLKEGEVRTHFSFHLITNQMFISATNYFTGSPFPH